MESVRGAPSDSLIFLDLPDPDVLAVEIAGNLESALEQFRSVSQELAD